RSTHYFSFLHSPPYLQHLHSFPTRRSSDLVDYGFRWHVGDRLTLLSDGFYDGFDQGLRQVTAGALMSRPQYGSVYVGYRQTEGPDRKSTRLNSSHVAISYAVFCLKKKNTQK